MKDNDKIVKYLDIPIQHADEDVLRAMNRSGSAQSLLERIAHIRELLPDAALRTTLITGFPGETERQFETLCRFVKQARFERLGVFAYSAEKARRGRYGRPGGRGRQTAAQAGAA